jgi:hypothetical protein
MHTKTLFALTIALACCTVPGSVRAQAANSQDNTDSPAAVSAVAQMAPAQAVLAQELDTKNARPGQQFKAVLSDTVHLKSGVELPRGTTLVGTVATEGAPEGAKTALALRFTQADLKSGKMIPIEATIVGIAPPVDNMGDSSSEQTSPEAWDGAEMQFDMIGVLSSVDLHSRIAGENSGVFVSATKSNIKLAERTQLALAIGVQETTGMSGGF